MPDSWYNNTRKGCVDMELKALRISEKKAEVLHSMQIMRVEDLLTCYPFRYEHPVSYTHLTRPGATLSTA